MASKKLDIEWLIKEEMELSNFNEARNEVTSENAKVFIRMLEKHRDLPSSKNIRNTVLENIKLLNKSMDILNKNKNLIYSSEDIKSLFDILKSMEEYFNQYGLQRPLGLQLRKAYLKVNSYLQSLRQPLYTEKKIDLNDPNQIYLSAYRRFLSENIQRTKQGLNPKNWKWQWGLNSKSEKGEIEILALSDSLKQLRSGLDYSKHRGDLRYYFGIYSRCELSDKTIGSIAQGMLDKKRKGLIRKVQLLEGIQEKELSLSKDEQLAHSLIKRAKKNRGI